jgi:hypothetical protein
VPRNPGTSQEASWEMKEVKRGRKSEADGGQAPARTVAR